ncbi:MAG: hypothetical protein WDZ27_02890 [Waddliaceae bacterium]
MANHINAYSFDQKISDLPGDRYGRVYRTRHLHRRNLNSSTEDPIFPKFSECSHLRLHGLNDLATLVDTYRLSIENHHHDRITTFFYAAISTYQLGYTFSLGKTLEQAEPASKLPDICQRNACHSSLIPTLTVRDCLFLPGSDLYHMLNRTNELPRKVNEADMRLEYKMRQVAIDIINEGSKGSLTPFKATKILIQKCSAVLSGCQSDLILKLYYECNRKIEKNLNKEYLQSLLGLTIVHSKDEKVISLKRVQFIQNKHILQSKIYAKFKQTTSILLNNGKNSAYFQDAIMYALISLMKGLDRKRLQNLFSIPPKDYYFNSSSSWKSKVLETKVRYLVGQFQVISLAMDISKMMAIQRKRDRQIQKELIVQLRGKDSIPIKIDTSSIKKWCIRYQVHESAFFPGFFYS